MSAPLLAQDEVEALTELLMLRLQHSTSERGQEEENILGDIEGRIHRMCGVASSSSLAQEISEAPQNAAATAVEMRADRKPKVAQHEILATVSEVAVPVLPPRWPTATLQKMTAYPLQ